MVEAYEHYYSNVHRGPGHRLAVESSAHYESARESVRQLLNPAVHRIISPPAPGRDQPLSLKLGRHQRKAGDEILLTLMEHHSNIVPWQQLATRTGCKIAGVPIRDSYHSISTLSSGLLSAATKLVAITAVSTCSARSNSDR